MRNLSAVLLGLALPCLASAPASARVEADIFCGVLKNKKVDFVVPPKAGDPPRQLTRSVACAVGLKPPSGSPSPVGLTASVVVKSGAATGPSHTGAVTADGAFELRLEPGKDFQSCVDFRIEARINGAKGVEWEQLLDVPQGCAAKPIKAKLWCAQKLSDGSTFELATKGDNRISGSEIDCDLTSKDPRFGGVLTVAPSWHKVDEHHVDKLHRGEPQTFQGPFAEGDKIYFQFTLARGTDWDECASDITIPVKVTSASGALLYQEERVYHQDCRPIPVAPPVGSNPPPNEQLPVGILVPGQSVRFSEHELEKLPDDAARSVAISFAQMMVDGDGEIFSHLFPKGGIVVGKKRGVQLDIGDVYAATGIRKLYGCEDRKGPDCKWAAWNIQLSGKNEFWLYNSDESDYGPFPSAVFQKRSDRWQWVAARKLDLGEP